MSEYAAKGFGWKRDLPDIHDYTIRHPQVRTLLDRLGGQSRAVASVDWREFSVGIDDQGPCNCSTANACVGLLQYCERRAKGRVISPSRLFVYKTSRRLANDVGDNGSSIRYTWKAIARFGTANEQTWPFETSRVNDEPDAFAYALNNEFESIRYVRLDEPDARGDDTLRRVRDFLSAGFAVVFGFSVHDSIRQSPDIALPSVNDAMIGGQSVIAVGYDDNRRHRSEKGALLIKNSWGGAWGDSGYGWLPYDYVRRQLAADFWVILKPEWIDSGEFHLPPVCSNE